MLAGLEQKESLGRAFYIRGYQNAGIKPLHQASFSSGLSTFTFIMLSHGLERKHLKWELKLLPAFVMRSEQLGHSELLFVLLVLWIFERRISALSEKNILTCPLLCRFFFFMNLLCMVFIMLTFFSSFSSLVHIKYTYYIYILGMAIVISVVFVHLVSAGSCSWYLIFCTYYGLFLSQKWTLLENVSSLLPDDRVLPIQRSL